MSTAAKQDAVTVQLIPPHGGKLVNRLAGESARAKLSAEAKGLTKIVLNVQQQCDVEMCLQPAGRLHGGQGLQQCL
jgi:hypothetical protein